jgi:hypothetical protein
MEYKIDNIPVKEFDIKFLATLENGKTLDLTKFIIKEQDADTISAYWEFSDACCEIFGKDGNLPLSEIDDYAELHSGEK